MRKITYGLDYSDRGPVIVRAEHVGRTVKFGRVTEVPESGRAALAASLATHEAFVRWLAAPLASVEKARKVLPSLLDVQLPFPLEKCVYDFPEVAVTADRHSEALAVAARLEDVTAALRRLNDAGFDPIILDHEALALWAQAMEESPPHGDEIRAVLYLGVDRSALVLGRGRRFLAAQGSRQSAPDPARLQQFLRAQLGEGADQPFAWALVGPGADDKYRAVLHRPADTPFLIYKEPATFLARALAARALQKGPLRCNLRRGPVEHPQGAVARADAISGAVRFCLAAGLALCLLNVGWMYFLKSREAVLQRAVSGLAAELSGLPKVPKGQEVMIAQRALDERAPRLAAFAEMFSPSKSDLMAPILAVAGKAGLQFTTFSLKDRSLELAGSAPTWAAADALGAQLAKDGWTMDLERGDAGADERVPFSVKASK